MSQFLLFVCLQIIIFYYLYVIIFYYWYVCIIVKDCLLKCYRGGGRHEML